MLHVKAYRYYILKHLFLQDKNKCIFPASPVFETFTMEEMNFELSFDEDMMWDDYVK